MSDPTLTGFENWPSSDAPAKARAGGVASTMLPIVFGLAVGVGIGAWYVSKSAVTSKGARGPTLTDQMSSYVRSFGGQSGKSAKSGKKGMSWQDQLKKQGEDDLQRIQDDIQDRLNNQWRPGR